MQPRGTVRQTPNQPVLLSLPFSPPRDGARSLMILRLTGGRRRVLAHSSPWRPRLHSSRRPSRRVTRTFIRSWPWCGMAGSSIGGAPVQCTHSGRTVRSSATSTIWNGSSSQGASDFSLAHPARGRWMSRNGLLAAGVPGRAQRRREVVSFCLPARRPSHSRVGRTADSSNLR